MIKNLFFKSNGATSAARTPDEELAKQTRQQYQEMLASCSELKQRGYQVQLCFSHLDRSKSFRPEELVRIDIEVSNTKHL
jgi:hypothetical protein